MAKTGPFVQAKPRRSDKVNTPHSRLSHFPPVYLKMSPCVCVNALYCIQVGVAGKADIVSSRKCP